MLFGFLINTVCGPIKLPLKDYGLSHENLSTDCDRMVTESFVELMVAT